MTSVSPEPACARNGANDSKNIAHFHPKKGENKENIMNIFTKERAPSVKLKVLLYGGFARVIGQQHTMEDAP